MARPVRFVGREGELSRLLGALGGGARLVLVVGDAGAGKTRFVTEAMARAAAAGMVMVRGECLPLAGTLPLLPVRDALGEVARLEGGGLLAAALDAAPGYVREEMGVAARDEPGRRDGPGRPGRGMEPAAAVRRGDGVAGRGGRQVAVRDGAGGGGCALGGQRDAGFPDVPGAGRAPGAGAGGGHVPGG